MSEDTSRRGGLAAGVLLIVLVGALLFALRGIEVPGRTCSVNVERALVQTVGTVQFGDPPVEAAPGDTLCLTLRWPETIFEDGPHAVTLRIDGARATVLFERTILPAPSALITDHTTQHIIPLEGPPGIYSVRLVPDDDTAFPLTEVARIALGR
ncbi:MAG: hypothetical protein ACFB51_09625 [Anaerolineae bacterium]